MSGGLTRRMVIAGGLLALLVGACFAVLYFAIATTRDSQQQARPARVELAAADQLEKLVVDLETGVRGFVITREERFLEPWKTARSAFPATASALIRLADEPGQAARARQIARAIRSYIREYSIPVVSAVRRDQASARSIAVTAEGKRRVDSLRTQFDRFRTVERAFLDERQAESDSDARRAIVLATAGLLGSILLIVLFTIYLVRGIVHPVSRAAAMAGRLAGGDLAARMPETGTAEIGDLEKSFNTMAGSLEESRDELQRLADEQAALRRVATLVARGVLPETVFAAVTEEVGRLLGTDLAAMGRYESDDTATGLATWAAEGEHHPLVPGRWSLDGGDVASMVARTGRSVRIDDYDGATGRIAAYVRDELGVASSAGSPIVVEGRLWGALFVHSRQIHQPLPQDTESRLSKFTELVATAIANTESRTELTASRARVVAAADETRRRIERDLHDGAQQRLVSLALELRGAEAGVPAGLDELKAQLSQTTRGLTEVLEDLQEISRGIHPAILSKGGMGSALKTLARRSAVPVELEVRAGGRLPEPVEVAVYYVVAEALTNAAKHADASVVHVDVEASDAVVRLSIRDDGIGGADQRGGGSGLVGLRDRVEALGGKIEIASPVGSGTTLIVTLPVDVG